MCYNLWDTVLTCSLETFIFLHFFLNVVESPSLDPPTYENATQSNPDATQENPNAYSMNERVNRHSLEALNQSLL